MLRTMPGTEKAQHKAWNIPERPYTAYVNSVFTLIINEEVIDARLYICQEGISYSTRS